MGRYISGDINRKLWFAAQNSNAEDRFGVEGCEPNYINYYFNKEDSQEIIDAIKEVYPTSLEFDAEFERIFNYANSNSYGTWWKLPEANKLYKFPVK